MKRKNNAGFSLVEVLVAIAVLAAIVIPVCSSMVLSVQVNTKAEDVLQARVAVSSAVETLMAKGIEYDRDDYDKVDGADLFPGVEVKTTKPQLQEGEPLTYYIVKVTDDKHLVTITTNIRAVEPTATEEEGTE